MTIKISHNKNLLLIIIILLALLVLTIALYLNKETLTNKLNQWTFFSSGNQVRAGICVNDIDCVPAECCHPSSCVSANNKPDCSDIFCTQECKPGTLDCNKGYCSCVDGKCQAVFNE